MTSDEVDPMRDLGLVQDREVVCEPIGLLTPSDPMRDLFDRFIPNGAHLFDLFEKYDFLTAFVLNSGSMDGGALKYMAPFLKAFGVTDYRMSRFFEETVALNPGAAPMMRYLMDIMPVFMNTSACGHAADAVCKAAGVPVADTGSTEMSLDDHPMPVDEMRRLRDVARRLARMPVPEPSDSDSLEISRGEATLVSAIDEIVQQDLGTDPASSLMRDTRGVSLSEKSYNLLDIRKSTQIDLDGVMYIGGENDDIQVLSLVSESGGLAISFNGTEAAAESSKIAVIAADCTVMTFLGSIFFDTGPQGVMDLAADWTRENIAGMDAPDPNLRDALLRMHPDSLPEVYLMDGSPRDAAIAERSALYRRKMSDNDKLRRAISAGSRLSDTAPAKRRPFIRRPRGCLRPPRGARTPSSPSR